MVGLMVFAAVVAVVQLAVVGSLTRSVRISTLLQAIAIGAVVCAPVTVAVQWLITRTVAAFGSSSLSTVVAAAGWTYDPAIEEVIKVLPLVLLAWLWPKVHCQLGWTDHLLLGSAIGMGFSLCEAALRHARIGMFTVPVQGGYLVHVSLAQQGFVPSLERSLTSWQPQPVTYEDLFSFGNASPGLGHAMWTAFAALGIAWTFRRKGWLRLVGVLPLGLASLSHAAFNASLARESFANTVVARVASWVIETMQSWLVLVIVALVVVDRVIITCTLRGQPNLLLPKESAHGLFPNQILKAAFIAPP
jgi:RsiW-degrading membrane proteinase PrsW (M82 family)